MTASADIAIAKKLDHAAAMNQLPELEALLHDGAKKIFRKNLTDAFEKLDFSEEYSPFVRVPYQDEPQLDLDLIAGTINSYSQEQSAIPSIISYCKPYTRNALRHALPSLAAIEAHFRTPQRSPREESTSSEDASTLRRQNAFVRRPQLSRTDESYPDLINFFGR